DRAVHDGGNDRDAAGNREHERTLLEGAQWIARTARPFGEHNHRIALADELARSLVRLERGRAVAPLYRNGSNRTSAGAEDRDPEQFRLRHEAVLRQLRTEHEHVVPGHVV